MDPTKKKCQPGNETCPEMTEEFMQHVFAEAEGIAILSSCKQQQVSWEWHEKGQSVFTYYLLESLQGAADFDKKGFVTIGDVNRDVTDKVKSWSVQENRVQIPTLQYTAVGDIVLITTSDTTKPEISDHSENPGVQDTAVNNKHAEKAIEKKAMKKTKTDVLKTLYQAYRETPGEWVNSELIRKKLEIESEQMHDFVLALDAKKLIETNYLGDRALLKITADGVTILQDS